MVEAILLALTQRRKQGLAGEPVSMRGRLEFGEDGTSVVVDVLLDSGELLSFRQRGELRPEALH